MGTRPEIIRLSVLLKAFENYGIDNFTIYTNQNFHESLSTIFIEELGVKIDHFIDKCPNTDLKKWIENLNFNIEKLIKEYRPDFFLVLGDTNSALSAFVAKKYEIPIVHLESGNRSFDMKMPEERNRIQIDHISDFLLPYTENSKENLIREGVDEKKIFVSGNPIVDVLSEYSGKIKKSKILKELNLKPQEYFLVTIHRNENTENNLILKNIVEGINLVSNHYHMPVIWGMHPRTNSKIQDSNLVFDKNVKILSSFDFFNFVMLEQNAYMILTDSGTVQEEASLFNVPTVTVRNSTERPETIWCKSNILSGTENPNKILEATKVMAVADKNWISPYIKDGGFSNRVINFLKNTFK